MLHESVFVTQLVDILKSRGYEAVQEPTEIPHINQWRGPLPFFKSRRRYRPDILVGYRGNYALVEAKRDLFPGSVIHAREYADHFNLDVVLCVPDESAPRITTGVRRFAEDNNVRVCSQSELGQVMDGILRIPE